MNSFSASGKCIYYQIEVTITMYRNHCNFIDVLPYMLKDPKSSPDHKKIIQLVSASIKY